MLRIEDIQTIKKRESGGYEIIFNNNRSIFLKKRRTIISLLILIKYQIGSEADLSGSNNRLATIKSMLSGKYKESWIKDRYGDANKPFSELWTEEGFSFIRAEGMSGNKQYVLDIEDHTKLFNQTEKVIRVQLNDSDKKTILSKQNNRCNICNSQIKPNSEMARYIFSKDRVRLEFDHRIPVEKGGDSDINNYQALCHYCNKSKRQICFICEEDKCSYNCALVSPESSDIILATNENISDRKKS